MTAAKLHLVDTAGLHSTILLTITNIWYYHTK